MNALFKRVVAPAVLCGLLVPTVSFATNGYFLIGFGAKSRSMGGVGVAYAQDGLAAASNPAGMTAIKMDTMRMDMGADLFNPPRAYKQDSAALENGFPGSDGAVNHKSGSNLFLIPNMGGVYKFNRKMMVGMAAVGAGLGTRYDQTIPGNPTCMDGNTSGGSASTFFNFNCLGGPTVGVTLYQMQMLPSIAYKVTKNHAVGASLALGVQMFRAYGLQAFDALGFAASSDDLTNRVECHALGFRFVGVGVSAHHHVRRHHALHGHGQRVRGVVTLPGLGPVIAQHASRLAGNRA